MLYKEAVSPGILDILNKFMEANELKAFRLVGGTALSLQLGHRESVDIDLFSFREFPKDILRDTLKNILTNLSELEIGERSLSFYTNNIKVDFYAMSNPFIRPELIEDNIRMAAIEDIAAMKLDAITSRATKKDYYDIAELLNKYTFKTLLGFYIEKYPECRTRNVIDIIKDIPLRNFELEKSTPPKSFRNITWNDVIEKVFNAFDTFRYEELQAKIEEMKKRKKK